MLEVRVFRPEFVGSSLFEELLRNHLSNHGSHLCRRIEELGVVGMRSRFVVSGGTLRNANGDQDVLCDFEVTARCVYLDYSLKRLSQQATYHQHQLAVKVGWSCQTPMHYY